ncbi:uncharacterized protein FOMMEDRAFT_156750 [Fomitiporia mediterranea MF3/22]|uniref:uncharacterized protein n=1 Tax=Fomitiporia mediterranea (strain MF3/22) TaxID=694068 RepID=UPI0004407D27|nr:uncharacterized protein FOMMEDRAFT_156750 [Fomitiporia mediterranea MF3/22]EJD03351.1 hypothetical protein FOMMEDRAFT_156750 [Fomitiporia mediterranea MF3/22]
MSMCDHSQGTILFPTLRTLSFPTHHFMLDIILDGPTPRAFTFPSVVHDTISNHRSSGPPLTPPEPSPSTPSTSPSPFEPERPRDTPLQSSTTTTQFTAPPIARRSQSMQRARTQFRLQPKSAALTLRISTLVHHSSLLHTFAVHLSLLLFSYPPTLTTLSPLASHPPTCLTSATSTSTIHTTSRRSPYAHAIQLAGPSDDRSVVTKTTSTGPKTHSSPSIVNAVLKKKEVEAVAAAEGDPVTRRQRQADLSKTISNRWCLLSAEERKYWDDLAKQWEKGTKRCGLERN